MTAPSVIVCECAPGRFVFSSGIVGSRSGIVPWRREETENAIVSPQASFFIPTATRKGSGRTLKLDGRQAEFLIDLPPSSSCSSHPRVLEALVKEAFHIGQLVRIARSAVRDGDFRTYCIVCLVSEEDDAPVYRIKNTVGIEHLVKADQIEPAAQTAVP